MYRIAIVVGILLCFVSAGIAQVHLSAMGSFDSINDSQAEAVAMAVDNQGNMYITGSISGAEYEGVDWMTVKFGTDGQVVWNVKVSGTALNTQSDEPYDIAVDSEGNVYVTGSVDQHCQTVKYSEDGKVMWQMSYQGQSTDPVWSCGRVMAIDENGYIYVAGDEVHQESQSINLIKYDSAGNQMWIGQHDLAFGTSNEPYEIAFDSQGDIIVIGRALVDEYPADITNFDYLTLKFDSAGNLLWSNKYGGPYGYDEEPIDVTIDASDNIYVTGTIVGDSYQQADWTWATLKYSPEGGLLWDQLYPDNEDAFDGYARCISLDSQGNVIVCGYAEFSPQLSADYAAVKYNSEGELMWDASYDAISHDHDDARYMAIDEQDEIYITGYTHRYLSDNYYDITTIKVNSSGNMLWEERYMDRSDWRSIPCGIVVDENGNIYVGGMVQENSINSDFLALFYYQVQVGVEPDTNPAEIGSFEVTAHPNPFNPSTVLNYELQIAGSVSLSVFDLQGCEVATLVDGYRDAGAHEAVFDGTGLASGVYLYRFEAESQISMGKIVLLK